MGCDHCHDPWRGDDRWEPAFGCNREALDCQGVREELAEALTLLAETLSALETARSACLHGEDARHVCDWRLRLDRVRRRLKDRHADLLHYREPVA